MSSRGQVVEDLSQFDSNPAHRNKLYEVALLASSMDWFDIPPFVELLLAPAFFGRCPGEASV